MSSAREGSEAPFTPEQEATIASLEADLSERLAHKPRRLSHSLNVGHEAERLARIYGVDPYLARLAGILHDWEKATRDAELVDVARDLGIELAGDELEEVAPLLHGYVAAKTLPERYPWLPEEVLRAIERHTVGAADMGPLDMVLFVADGIEPSRGSVAALDAQRELVGTVSLEELWWRAFRDTIAYVVETGRHLYPGTIAIYNEVAARRA